MNQARFCRLWARCTAHPGAGDEGAAVFGQLSAHYGEAHRHYHSGDHIDHCLRQMDEAAATLGHSDAVELALWFHDAIYTPGAADNEARSAAWFAEVAAASLPAELIREVEGHILATTHRERPQCAASRYVVDVDLSGFGQESAMFWHDGNNIRREASHLSDCEFIRAQGAFLRALLDRPRIFWTDHFHDSLDARARRNIEDALACYGEGRTHAAKE